jgi:thiamine kinase-like enzyme
MPLHPATIRSPKVHHFFRDTRTGIGYLAMEWINGAPIDTQDRSQADALRTAMGHLAAFKRAFPGLILRGEPQGIFWEDGVPSVSDTVKGLSDWVNIWQHEQMDFQCEDLMLCHLDTAVDNILWLSNGQICFLD